jgi:hypothetical protein
VRCRFFDLSGVGIGHGISVERTEEPLTTALAAALARAAGRVPVEEILISFADLKNCHASSRNCESVPANMQSGGKEKNKNLRCRRGYVDCVPLQQFHLFPSLARSVLKMNFEVRYFILRSTFSHDSQLTREAIARPQ